MINALHGDIVSFTTDSLSLLSSGGIEFSLIISARFASGLCNEKYDKKNVRILTYLSHSEDSMTLFGFSGEDERSLFLSLITVNGIGPKQAMKILSGAEVSDILRALDNEDVAFLSKIPGLGAKTSQKILLALRDKLVASPTKTSAGQYSDIAQAFCDMGYDKKRVAECINSVAGENSGFLKSASKKEADEFMFKTVLFRLG